MNCISLRSRRFETQQLLLMNILGKIQLQEEISGLKIEEYFDSNLENLELKSQEKFSTI